ncbi:MAG: hypothetical protein IH597_14875 [Bacteroidales bacterium]|nr:hypothetical protein [Bacteroidales bacterium]
MAENTDLRLTVEAWADIVMDNWLDKIDKLKIGLSWQLEDSLKSTLISNAGGLPERVEFTFNYYGKFVDMGVGKGVTIDMVKDRSDHRRRPKKWYSATMYAEIIKLREILAKKYGRIAAITIIENIDDNALRWTGERV